MALGYVAAQALGSLFAPLHPHKLNSELFFGTAGSSRCTDH